MEPHMAPLETFYDHSSVRSHSAYSTLSHLRLISPSLESLLKSIEDDKATSTRTTKIQTDDDTRAFAATMIANLDPIRCSGDRSSSDISDLDDEPDRRVTWKAHPMERSPAPLRITQSCCVSASRASQQRTAATQTLHKKAKSENFAHRPKRLPPKQPSLRHSELFFSSDEVYAAWQEAPRHGSPASSTLRFPDIAMLTPSRPAPKPPVRKDKPSPYANPFKDSAISITTPPPHYDDVPRLHRKLPSRSKHSPAPSYSSHRRLRSSASIASNETASTLAYSQAQTCVELHHVARRNPSIMSMNTVFSTPGRDELERKQALMDRFAPGDGPFGSAGGVEELKRKRAEVSGEYYNDGRGKRRCHDERGWLSWLAGGCLGRS